MWKSKITCFGDKMTIPYILYYDDFEVNNALGSHATEHTLVAFYYSFPTFPGHLLSSPENIFVALIFKSRDFQNGSTACLSLLIDEIKSLEEKGSLIQTTKASFQVHFLLYVLIKNKTGKLEF